MAERLDTLEGDSHTIVSRCSNGHELAAEDLGLCVDCFNAQIDKAPVHLVGISLAIGFVALTGAAILQSINPLNWGDFLSPRTLMYGGVIVSMYGIGNAVLFKFTVAHLSKKVHREPADAYPRSMVCPVCRSEINAGRCRACTRRRQNRNDAILLCWLPTVIIVTLGIIISLIAEPRFLTVFGIGLAAGPHLIYAKHLSKKLPSFKQ